MAYRCVVDIQFPKVKWWAWKLSVWEASLLEIELLRLYTFDWVEIIKSQLDSNGSQCIGR